MAKTAFIGLGVMGFPMAGHLAATGHEVAVYNRTAAKAADWAAQYGGSPAETPAQAARGAEFIMICVGDDPDLQEVVAGETGALSGAAQDAVIVDHTTASAQLARALAETARARGVHFIDAPVSGGQAGAENGVLTVMCGGEPAAFERAEPVIAAYARACRLMGPSGSGQLAKMCNQICIAGLVQGLSEALAFAERAGLDGTALVDVISKGAAGSWQMENRHQTMLDDDFNHGFAVDWMRKDLRICLEESRRNGASLPVTALVDQFYAELQRMGGGRWDTSSLIKRLR